MLYTFYSPLFTRDSNPRHLLTNLQQFLLLGDNSSGRIRRGCSPRVKESPALQARQIPLPSSPLRQSLRRLINTTRSHRTTHLSPNPTRIHANNLNLLTPPPRKRISKHHIMHLAITIRMRLRNIAHGVIPPVMAIRAHIE